MALIQRKISYLHLQIDTLDGLRGLAVLMVFASHASNRGLYFLPYLNFEGIGKSGVFLFFVLSSFLLTRLFLASPSVAGSFILNYGIRRFLRIYPLFFFYLFLALLGTIFDFSIKSPFALASDQFIQHILLSSSFGVTWSIAVEFKYYFILPLIALIYRHLLSFPISYAFIFTFAVIVLFGYFFPESQSSQNDIRVWPYIPLFIQGGFAAFLYQRWQGLSSDLQIKYSPVISFSGLVAIIGLVWMMPSVYALLTNSDIIRTRFHHMFILHGFLWSLFLLASICVNNYLNKFFQWTFIRYLGFISFSLYLFHVVVLDWLKPFYLIPGMSWAALFLAIAISHLTWTLIEKPSSKLFITNKN